MKVTVFLLVIGIISSVNGLVLTLPGFTWANRNHNKFLNTDGEYLLVM